MCVRASQKRSENLKKWLDLGHRCNFNKGPKKCGEVIRQRTREVGLPEKANWRTLARNCRVDKGCLVRFVPLIPTPGALYSDQASSLPGMGEGNTFARGNLCRLSEGKPMFCLGHTGRGQGALSVPAMSPLPLA